MSNFLRSGGDTGLMEKKFDLKSKSKHQSPFSSRRKKPAERTFLEFTDAPSSSAAAGTMANRNLEPQIEPFMTSANGTLPLSRQPSNASTTQNSRRSGRSVASTVRNAFSKVQKSISSKSVSTKTALNETLLWRNHKQGLCALHKEIHTFEYEETFPVDIVALHGLNGDAFLSWTNESTGMFWLGDLLPGEFPGARIYTFAYPSKMFSRGTGVTETFAESLLGELKNERGMPEHQRRPIIFIAHSMGGIVVKKALNIASKVDRFANILDSVSAILFVATPHRGSKDVGLLTYLTSLSNVALRSSLATRWKGEVRGDLLEALKRDSPGLKEIAEEFVDLIALDRNNIHVFSFIEELKTKPLTRRIVDDESGRLGIPKEEIIHMVGEDHQTIIEYESRECPSYQRMLLALTEAVKEATKKRTIETSAADEPCLHSLAFLTMARRKLEASSRRQHDTCTWVVEHPSFTSWINSPHSLLWIKGHPGTGKSTIMAYIHEQFQRHLSTSRSISLEFFFTGRGEALQKSSIGMFRSLLHQIYNQSFPAREMILKAFEDKQRFYGDYGAGWEWQKDDLQALLTSVIKRVAEEREITIFVDALDEAVEDGEKLGQWLAGYFHGLNEDAKGQVAGVGGAKICISSRHHPVISTDGSSVEINVEEENRLDIKDFISSQFELGVKGWGNEAHEERQDLIDDVAEKAAGIFQWASVRVPKIITSINDGDDSLEGIRETIKSESNDLFSLYEMVFVNDIEVHHRKKALLFFQWICLSQRPLTLAEIRFAMACDSQEIPFSQDCCERKSNFIDSDDRMEKLTRSLSGGLAEVIPSGSFSVIQFVHQTVNDFLHDRGLQLLISVILDIQEMYSFNVIGESESRIAKSCVNYLRIDKVVDSARIWSKWPKSEEMPIFLEYTVTNLFAHAAGAERLGVEQKYMVELFELSPRIIGTWSKAYTQLNEDMNLSADGRPCLIHVASAWNLQSVVKEILHRNASVDEKDSQGNTPLHCAASQGHKELASVLLDHKANINEKNEKSYTPLVLAAANGHIEVVRLLLISGAKVTDSADSSENGLHLACKNGNAALVRILIEAGADVNARAKNGKGPTTLREASSSGHVHIATMLMAHGADVNAQCGGDGLDATALQAAAYGGGIQMVQCLLDNGADINAQGGRHGNALQAACDSGEFATVKLLLEEGANVNALGGESQTALQAACGINDTATEDIVRVLLEAGADANVQGGSYGSALNTTAYCGNKKIFQLLLEKGASVQVTGGMFDNVLQSAAAGGSEDIVRLLLDEGMDVNIRSGEGWCGSALQAAMERSQSLVELLLERGADVNAKGGQKGNALNAAIDWGKARFVRSLLDRGADVNMEFKDGVTDWDSYAIHRAARMGFVAIMRILLDYGADPNAEFEGPDGTPLKISAGRGNLEAVELLLKRGADVNMIAGPRGREWSKTALQLAAYNGHKKVVELLLANGADAEGCDGADEIICKARGGIRRPLGY